jgi:uncharacterized membrane protein
VNASGFHVRQVLYDLGSGLLVRPAVIIGTLGTLALCLPAVDRALALRPWLDLEPGTAQLILATTAGSMMTVVSVVYSILLVALSLTSIQFSTRILAGMVRDPVSQHTLGLFVGTFVYCLLVMGVVHADPPFVPAVSLAVALGLALGSLAGMVWFIHHVAQSIQANHLVDRIATETEAVIDEVFVARLEPGAVDDAAPFEPPPPGAFPVLASRSGYVQLIDVDGLRSLGFPVWVARPMGTFVPEGAVLAWTTEPGLDGAIDQAFDIGAVRTMQLDAEFGIRQIVDIALKAISPAVNDPSTAATCIDHLSRLLIRVAGRRTPSVRFGEVRLPMPSLAELIDLSVEQLRQYGRADMAVALRLLRALADVAAATRSPQAVARIALHARLLEKAARAAFPPEDCDELGRRVAVVRDRCGGA